MPVVSIPSAPSQDKELTFTCTSTNGYPRPNVYWINKTDNSLLDEALQNNTVSLNERGLYDVVSILKIQWSPNVNVGCCIENVLLHQNLTVSSQTGEVPGVCTAAAETTGGSGRRGASGMESVGPACCSKGVPPAGPSHNLSCTAGGM